MATGRAPVSNQEDTETLPDFGGVEEGFICDAGDAADVDEEEEEDPTDVVVSSRKQPSSPSVSEDTDGQVRKAVKPRKRSGVAHETSELCEPNPTHKHSSLLWRRGKDAVSNVLKRLRDQFKTARTMLAEIKKARTKQDTRSLTYLHIEKALSDPTGRDFSDVVEKLEKFDYRLHGIKVMGQGGRGKSRPGQKGTLVRDVHRKKTGEVTRFFVDEDTGYNGFEIQWKGCGGTSVYSTRDVLCGAERYGGNQGVTSPKEDDERVLLFLRGVVCMVNVQIQKYVIDDDRKIKRRRDAVTLPKEVCKKTLSLRMDAWKGIQVVSLADTMTEHEESILGKSGGGLLEEARRDGSLFMALGLGRYRATNTTGFVTNGYRFHDRHMTFVNHFVRGAQSSWKLGRPTSVESCIAPLSAGVATDKLSAGRAVDELSEEVDLPNYETKQTICTISPEDASKRGLGTRSLLARARVSTGYGVSDCFKWWAHCPLYRQMEFTRPEHLGDIQPTTENTTRVSQTRRHRPFYKSAVEISSTKDQDLRVLNSIFDGYDPVASDKRNEANAHENSLSRLGNGSKVDKGRTFSIEDWKDKCKFLADLVEENGIKPIMAKIGDAVRRKEVIEMCLDVLHDGGGATIGKRDDERHLYPEKCEEQIDEVVGVLAKAGVSTEDLEWFSCALHILDSLTSAYLRPQNSLGCLACKAYVKNGRLVFVLPPVGKKLQDPGQERNWDGGEPRK